MRNPFRFVLHALLLAGFAQFAAAQQAPNTVGGTVITNTATARYKDANQQDRSAVSNQVTSLVQKVHSFVITPGATPTETTDFNTAPGAGNDLTGTAGSDAVFHYTVTNNTNGPITVALDVLQDASDTFNLENVIIEYWNGSQWLTYPSGGLEFANQYDSVEVRVTGTVPAGAQGNEYAKIDLTGTNLSADQLGPGISFENNNIGRITVAAGPSIGVSKNVVGAPVNNGNGSYTFSYEFTVQNFGNVALQNVQVTDDLAAAFPSPATFTVNAISASGLTANTSFNGTSNTNMLAGNDTLAIGTSATISLTVTVRPGNNLGPYENIAEASGTSGGATYTDNSTPGQPQPGQSEATLVSFGESASIGLAKDVTVTDFGPENSGPFTVVFDFYVENFGDVNITNLALVDDLDAAFGAGIYTVTGRNVISSGPNSTITLNNNFNGSSDTNLLAAGSTLAFSESAQIRITVTVTEPGAYTNSATLSGTTPSGTAISRDSNAGTNPDPSLVPAPTAVSLSSLQLSKSVRICDSATSCSGPTTAAQTVVKPLQYIEYTIIATNLGGTALTEAYIDDSIPANTAFVSGSMTSSAAATCTIISGGSASSSTCPTTASPSTTNDGVTAVEWSLGTLASGQAVTVTFLVQVK